MMVKTKYFKCYVYMDAVRHFFLISILFCSGTFCFAFQKANVNINNDKSWPVLTEYDQKHIKLIALPLGGIGTGTVSLGGRGDLRYWENLNRPNKVYVALDPNMKLGYSFFTLYAKAEGEKPVTRAIEGALQPPYEGERGSPAINQGLPRFRKNTFRAAYPFGQVLLSDPDVPLDVVIEGFNPLVPGDVEASSIPIAVLRFVLTNKTDKVVEVSVCGTLFNYIGTYDGPNRAVKKINIFREDKKNPLLKGIFMRAEHVDPLDEQFGTLALSVLAETGVSYRTGWWNTPGPWGDSLLDFWDDFSADGVLEERDSDNPRASLAVSRSVPPHGTEKITFLLTWHFPNRMTLVRSDSLGNFNSQGKDLVKKRIGNYYTTQYSDAWDVVKRTIPKLSELEEKTILFVRSFLDSDLPNEVKEAALYNISTLRTQTTFRTENGYFHGWEGSGNTHGLGFGTCTHVWNYEQGTAFTFGELAKKMREVEFMYATLDNGLMAHRVKLPLEEHAQDFKRAAADGQMGCIMKIYRDWQLSGDDELLKNLWPNVKKALAFAWRKGGWDEDQDGVMDGPNQHNTMDVDYFGANPQMGIWYLGALRAAEEMGRYLNDTQFSDKCHKLFENGSKWIDANLFNGEYYEHKLEDPDEFPHQLGAGCLVDQLVGQYMAHVCGLGYLLDPQHVKTALQSIMKYNWRDNLYGHYNYFRSFALSDESALLMASYPKGRRPKRPFPYSTEIMTGFEYTAAIGMLYEGQIEEGLVCIKAIRKRYDGLRRNPFDEAEYGHHYARAMASWAAVLAMTGFQYSGVEGSIQFAAVYKPTKWFWSNGYAWGTFRQIPGDGKQQIELAVLHGTIKIKKLILENYGVLDLKKSTTIEEGETLTSIVPKNR